MDLKPTLNVRDCGSYLDLSKPTIDRLIKSGKLRSYKNGRLRKIKREWLLEYEKSLIGEPIAEVTSVQQRTSPLHNRG